MKFLARITLLAASLVAMTSLCLAQSSNRSDGPPPPPPAPALEYNSNSWKTFLSGAGFTVAMPGTPTYSTQKMKVSDGELTQHIYALNVGTRNYVINYSDFPNPMSDPKSIQLALDKVRDNLLAKSKSRQLLKERGINVKGYSGREFLLQEGDLTLRWRVLIAGKRIYQIVLGVSRNTAFSTGRPSADPADLTDFYQMISSKFFDSFSLFDVTIEQRL